MAAGGTQPPQVIAVDVGGTAIKAVRCGAAETGFAAQADVTRATPVSAGVPAVVDAIAAVIDELGHESVVGVGVIMPGVVDAEAGIARYSTNIGWRELPIRDQLAAATGRPVAIEHDVRAAGRAELTLGAARGYRDSLFVAIGTGIAAASIVNGTVAAGSGHLAGEIGHVPVYPDGARCACGQRGCAETYASAAAIARRYAEASGRAEPAERVIALAGQGDPAALVVFDQAVTALARCLVFATMLNDPEVIVLGGGLSLAGPALLDPLRAQLSDALAWRPPPALATAHFGARAGQIGAALLGLAAAR